MQPEQLVQEGTLKKQDSPEATPEHPPEGETPPGEHPQPEEQHPLQEEGKGPGLKSPKPEEPAHTFLV
jgi:hypothetical protein